MALCKVSRYCTAEVLQGLSVYFNMHKKQSKVASGQNILSTYNYYEDKCQSEMSKDKKPTQYWLLEYANVSWGRSFNRNEKH